MPISYAEDLIASNPANYIVGENHVFTGVNAESRMFIPDAAPFFSKDLEIRSVPGNVLLEPGTQYKALWMVRDAAMASGLEVCTVIYITDTAVDEVNVTYRTIGGLWTNNQAAIQAILDTLALPDANQVAWGQLLDVPAQFEPTEHLHHMRTVFGLEELLTMGESLRLAMINRGDAPVIAAMYQYIDRRLQDYLTQADSTALQTAIGTAVDIHKAEASPHTKAQIGLGSVQNFPVADDAQAYEGTSNVVYETPAQTVKTMFGALRTVGADVIFDPNDVAIKPIQLCRHDNCPTGPAGNAASDAFIVVTGFRVTAGANDNSTAPFKTQFAFGARTGSGALVGIYSRYYTSPSWSPWIRLDTPNSVSLGTNNLDTITASGSYHQTTTGNATAGRNYPLHCQSEISIMTVSVVGTNLIVQKIRNVNPSAAKPICEYVRYFNGTTWTNWRSDYNDVMSSTGALIIESPNATMRAVIKSQGLGNPTVDGVYYKVTTFFSPDVYTDNITSSTKRYQEAVPLDDNGLETQGIFQRYFDGTAWKDWKRVQSVTTTDGPAHRFTVASTAPNNTPNTILDPFFRFDIAVDGEGGDGLPLGNWYIENHFDSPGRVQSSTDYRTQFAYKQHGFTGNRLRSYVRRYNGAWDRWMKMDVSGVEYLAKTTNLNSVVIDGTYIQNDNTINTSEYNAANYPATQLGTLKVERLHDGTSGITGIQQTYQSHTTFGVWRRRSTGTSTWTNWLQVQASNLEPYMEHPIKQALRRAAACYPQFAGNSTVQLAKPTLIDSGFGTANFLSPGLLAPDGNVYCVGSNYTYGTSGGATPGLNMYVFDSATETLSHRLINVSGGLPANAIPPGTGQVFNAVAPGTGSVIYFYPVLVNAAEQGKIVTYDVFDDTFGYIDLPTDAAAIGWGSASLAEKTHVLYMPPAYGNKILKVNVHDNTATTLPTTSTATGGAPLYKGSQLALDGKIYCAPYNANKVLIINPADDSIEETDFGLDLSGGFKYLGILMAPDGRLFCIPASADNILMIDPATKTAQKLLLSTWSITTGSAMWSGGCVGPDGKLYFAPDQHNGVLVIDSPSYSIVNVGLLYTTVFTGSSGLTGFTQLPSGTLFAAPYSDVNYATLEFKKIMPMGMDLLMSPFMNKSL